MSGPTIAPLLHHPIPFNFTFILRATHLTALFRKLSESLCLLFGPRPLLATRRSRASRSIEG